VWSVSFTLISGGLGMFLLLAFYFSIDVWQGWWGWPFGYVGMNSIIIYVLHEVFATYFPFAFHNDGSHYSILISNYSGLIFANLIAYIMYRLQIFIKL
jgi:heparan-alpha-glucosaminide N-acetyltransferase